jgi:hypothetical protein
MRTPLCALAVLFVLACSPPKPVAYLQTAQDRATQQDVKAALGTPAVMKPMPDGGTEWIYRSWDHDGGSRVTASSAWCDEYRLVFDSAGMLRAWDHERTRHVGEMMPVSCRKAVAATR